MENYYLKNNETGKLNIYTTKSFYDALPVEKKKDIKQFCLWSNRQQCWISKGKAENCHYLKTALTGMGFQDAGSAGERLPFEEQVRIQQEKATDRAERSAASAEKAEQKSGQLYDQAKKMADVIPFGQPILVGHYSEGKDRRYREKIHNTFGKAFAEQDKAGYYEQKAETARATAEGEKYKHVPYLIPRIKESQKLIRMFERRLLGKLYADSPEREISPERRDALDAKIKEEREKIEFYTKCFKAVCPDKSPDDFMVNSRKSNSKNRKIN